MLASRISTAQITYSTSLASLAHSASLIQPNLALLSTQEIIQNLFYIPALWIAPGLLTILEADGPPSKPLKPLLDKGSGTNARSGMKERMRTIPLQYFSIFVTEEIINQWADWTNANAKKYAEFNEAQARKEKDLQLRRQWESFEPSKQRWWEPTDAHEMTPQTPDYWSKYSDTDLNSEICKAMALNRWQQIKRYFKISNLLTDPVPNKRLHTQSQTFYYHLHRSFSQQPFTWKANLYRRAITEV